MAKTKLSKSTRGEFQRDLGWEPSPNEPSKFKPHRFRVGFDEREATIRIMRLEQVWDAVQARWRQRMAKSDSAPPRPLWDATTLRIAEAARKGESSVVIHPTPAEIPSWAWAIEFAELVKDFPMIRILAPDPEAVANGKQWWADHAARTAAQFTPVLETLANNGQTLHQALDDYAEWIPTKYVTIDDDGNRHTSDWGYTQLSNVSRLKERHPDMPLNALTLAKIESMMDFWAQRPPKKNRTQAISVASAEHQIMQLKMFFSWLHRRHEAYGWRKPPDLSDIRVKVLETQAERTAQNTPGQVDTYSVDELAILYSTAIPRERLYMLLALNCGFGQEEISSLTVPQIWINKAHPNANIILDFTSTDQDSFIFSSRSKTKVYGEWRLWPQTVVGLKHQLRHVQGNRLFARKDGRPLTAQTKSGTRGKAIANAWNRLTVRVRKSHPEVQELSFNKLRKTAGNMIRHIAGGEIFGVFTCHGQPVKTDDLADLYSNRPFAATHAAIEKAALRFEPMLKAVADPFPESKTDYRGNPGLPPLIVQQILDLDGQGHAAKEIAARLKISRTTVHRYAKGKRVVPR